MRVVMLGPPGAGKGTQSVRLARTLRVPHLSTGDILRSAISEATSLGLSAKAAVDSGQLVSDAIINGCVEDRLSKPDARHGFILDGFPRTHEQAVTLEDILERSGCKLDVTFELIVDVEHLQQRIAARAKDAAAAGVKIRSDDNEETLRNRIAIYHQQTAPLSDYYRQKGKLICIDGLAHVDTVTSNLLLEMETLMSKGLPLA